MCVALESKSVWSYTIKLFVMGETPAPSTTLKYIISHMGTQISPAAPFEVFHYVTRTKGSCWQKFLESNPWDYLSVPRATLAENPKGLQSVLSTSFIIFSHFLLLCSPICLGFCFDCKLPPWRSCLQDCQ